MKNRILVLKLRDIIIVCVIILSFILGLPLLLLKDKDDKVSQGNDNEKATSSVQNDSQLVNNDEVKKLYSSTIKVSKTQADKTIQIRINVLKVGGKLMGMNIGTR